MATIKIFDRSIQTFDKFAEVVRQSGHALTEAEAKRAAKKFEVPLRDVLALREQTLSRTHDAAATVEAASKDLRAETGFGVPAGMPRVQGLSQADKLRLGVGVDAPAKDAPTTVPAFIDVASVKVFWGVNLGDDKNASATAILEDRNKNRIHLQVPYKGDPPAAPTIGFFDQAKFAARPDNDNTTKIEMHPISATLAKDLIPLLDAAVAASPAGPVTTGPGHGAAVTRVMLEHCEGLVLKNGAPTRAEVGAQINEAAAVFDKGDYNAAERAVMDLCAVPFADLRGHAYHLLGEIRYRLGHNDEALRAVSLALPNASVSQRLGLFELAASCHSAMRRFDQAEAYATQAVTQGMAMRAAGAKLDLHSAHFRLAVAQKNLGKVDAAIVHLEEALNEKPGATFIELALAGYLGIAGKTAEAEKRFARIPVPPETSLEFLDYNTNATWFYAVNKNKAKVLEFAAKALEVAKRFHHPGTVSYFAVEPDLDWLRRDPEFQSLMTRYQV
ncbi:MAG: tetratricopeptide repeat protein [Deltaproteobacteria bacterium]|nr:tetratricopeptide repeat protein [Deltaproteobacteria bacterium]